MAPAYRTSWCSNFSIYLFVPDDIGLDEARTSLQRSGSGTPGEFVKNRVGLGQRMAVERRGSDGSNGGTGDTTSAGESDKASTSTGGEFFFGY